jgi:hypothetical protein
MAKIVIIIEDCTTQVSPKCTKTFERKAQRGRPAKSCEPCRELIKAGKAVSSMVANEIGKGKCPCGNVFDINPGRGRKPSKCHDCRTAGTVYRKNDDGTMDAIRAEALAEEQREIREQAGKDRAARLCDMMQPLIARDSKRRLAYVA